MIVITGTNCESIKITVTGERKENKQSMLLSGEQSGNALLLNQ